MDAAGNRQKRSECEGVRLCWTTEWATFDKTCTFTGFIYEGNQDCGTCGLLRVDEKYIHGFIPHISMNGDTKNTMSFKGIGLRPKLSYVHDDDVSKKCNTRGTQAAYRWDTNSKIDLREIQCEMPHSDDGSLGTPQ